VCVCVCMCVCVCVCVCAHKRAEAELDPQPHPGGSGIGIKGCGGRGGGPGTSHIGLPPLPDSPGPLKKQSVLPQGKHGSLMPRPPRGGSVLSSALRHRPRCSSGPQGLGGAPRALGRQPSARGEGERENPGVQSPWPLTAQTGVTFVSGPQTSKRTSGGSARTRVRECPRRPLQRNSRETGTVRTWLRSHTPQRLLTPAAV